MNDSSTDRPLTQDERDQLLSCLFRLYSAIYWIGEVQSGIISTLREDAGIKINAGKEGKNFYDDMSKAIELIDQLSKSLGVQVDGAEG